MQVDRQVHILLLRRSYAVDGTNGTLTYRGKNICHTIELPDRVNAKRVSCIPEGRYKLTRYYSKRFPNAIGVSQVPNRSGILFHAANDALSELQGCIAPVTTLTGAGRGSESNNALNELKALVNCLWDMGEEVYLLVK
ncbi:DUF5675 family protein [Sphingobacterium yanglingense]|uniref:DUF5675 domain-containing protein n=1 Tax=Sphingobacterium yanglingense TaxID=1437280 RepID=A0A4V3DE85_9SPHI|nr:DUF5675 family protein [Sphingobacterium yanglingense]TDQ79309.1 hypothetical protein CLV99_0745 [Sphingobacterium yanglingense]